MCDFISENKEEKTNRHLNLPTAAHFFAVCIREVSSTTKKQKDVFDVYRYFASADSEYWRGALKKSFLVGVWRVYFPHHSQTLRPGSRLMVVYLVCAGVGSGHPPSPSSSLLTSALNWAYVLCVPCSLAAPERRCDGPHALARANSIERCRLRRFFDGALRQFHSDVNPGAALCLSYVN